MTIVLITLALTFSLTLFVLVAERDAGMKASPVRDARKRVCPSRIGRDAAAE